MNIFEQQANALKKARAIVIPLPTPKMQQHLKEQGKVIVMRPEPPKAA